MTNLDKLVEKIEVNLKKYGDDPTWRLFIKVLREQDKRIKELENKHV